MIRRLRKKFIAAAIAAVFLVLLVLIGAINVINLRGLVVQADRTLQILSENKGAFPGQMFLPQDQPAGPPAPSEREALPAEGPAGGLFAPWRVDSKELAYQSRYCTVWYDGAGAVSRIDLDHLASLTEEEALALAGDVFAAGKAKGFAGDYRYRRAADGGETMLLLLNCERELSTFRGFLYASIGISLAGTLAVFLLLLLISGRIVRPIAESYEKQKRFITDAGHELKTPITIIRADADVLASELDTENEWIEDIRGQTSRLAELTADLIYLSKMEEDDPALQMQELSFSELADETARSFQALARSKGRNFLPAVAPGLRVTGDEKALAKLVSILLDNAMKYSPEGGTVELILERAGKNARLTVKNSTRPMERGNADRLFGRFTRADLSRSTESGGFGLGLAIARAVTEAHRGTIHAVSEDGASLTVTAEFPLCS